MALFSRFFDTSRLVGGAAGSVLGDAVTVMPYYPPTPAGQIVKRADGIIGGLTDFGRFIVDLLRP